MEKKQCSETVWNQDAWKVFPCRKNAKVVRDGKNFCTIHDPEYIKAKDEKREQKYRKSACLKCEYHLEDWYKYCPYCGTKKAL